LEAEDWLSLVSFSEAISVCALQAEICLMAAAVGLAATGMFCDKLFKFRDWQLMNKVRMFFCMFLACIFDIDM